MKPALFASPPRLSVVMPVRNAGAFLDEAVESILGQSFRDFEFVILDDGSTDGSTERLRNWAARDSRIRLFTQEQSLGPAGSSDWVVRQSSAPLIARMDADDVAAPDRLERQIAAMDANREAVLVGSLWVAIDARGRIVRPRDRWRLARRSSFAPFPHGSILFRREAYDRIGGYRTEAEFWEDADLYVRMAAVGRLLVLPEALYRHRLSAVSTRLTNQAERVERSVDRMYRSLGPARGKTKLRADGKLDPRVFVSIGSTWLWAGRSPQVLARLLKRGALGLNPISAAVLLWTLWATISPKSLRFCLRQFVRARDYRVRSRFPDGRIYEWKVARVRAASPRVDQGIRPQGVRHHEPAPQLAET